MSSANVTRFNLWKEPPVNPWTNLDRFPVRTGGLFAEWLDTEPEVTSEKWFKRFPQMIVCGEGQLVKTFLNAQQFPIGKEVF